MTKRELNLIREALLVVERREVAAMDTFSRVDEPHSDRYLEKIDALLSSAGEKMPRLSLKKKIIAALIAAAILLFATACVFREPILDFVERVSEAFTSFSTDVEQKKIIEEHYLPTYIPEGYVETSVAKNKTSANAYWSNGEREIILMQYLLGKQNASLDTEDGGYTVDYIGEQAVYYICKNNTYVFLWENDEYSFILNCPEDLGLDGVKRFIGSLEPNN